MRMPVLTRPPREHSFAAVGIHLCIVNIRRRPLLQTFIFRMLQRFI